MAEPQRVLNDLVEYEEDSRSAEGLTLYRVISRLVYGDPNEHILVRDAVIDHYLRVWFNARHPLHQSYLHFPGNVIAHLYQPDLCPEDGTIETVLRIITNALSIRLKVLQSQSQVVETPNPRPFVRASRPCTRIWKNAPRMLYEWEGGPVTFPVYHVGVIQQRLAANPPYRFTSLVEDESGKCLLEFLLDQKRRSRSLLIREMRCTWQGTNDRVEPLDLEIWNEADPERGPKNPGRFQGLNSFCVFSVNVRDSKDIRAAVILLKQAMARAPAQSIPVRTASGQKAPLKPYCALDGEFLFRRDPNAPTASVPAEGPNTATPSPVDGAGPALDAGDNPDERMNIQHRNNRAEEGGESLCGVLSVAVDRHLCVSFHLLDMLETATSRTVDDIEYLGRQFLFNPGILKLWFNFQEDIRAVNATIAHFYQLTPRPVYRYWIGHSMRPQYRREHEKQPTWVVAGEHLQNVMPPDMKFQPNNDETGCAFHNENTPDLNGVYACPCIASGNLDISTILDHFNAQYSRAQGRSWWWESRFRLNYGKLLKMMLGKRERLYPLLNYWKNAPNRYEIPARGLARGQTNHRDAFYGSLGDPDIEQDNEKMGYIFNDIVGIAIMFRYLTTSDFRSSVLKRLTNVHRQGASLDIDSSEIYDENGTSVTELSPFGLLEDIQLIDDNRRLWSRENIAGLDMGPPALPEPEPGTEEPEPEPETEEPEPEPETGEPEPETGEPEPETEEPEAEIGEAEAETEVSEPEAEGSEPEIREAEAETGEPEAETEAPEPQTVVPEPGPPQHQPDIFLRHPSDTFVQELPDPLRGLSRPNNCSILIARGYYEHEKRFRALRDTHFVDYVQQPWDVRTIPPAPIPGRVGSENPDLYPAHAVLFDPCKLILPDMCTYEPTRTDGRAGMEGTTPEPILGSNESYRVHLLEIIQHTTMTMLPPGIETFADTMTDIIQTFNTKDNPLNELLPAPLLQLAPITPRSATKEERITRRNHRLAWILYMRHRAVQAQQQMAVARDDNRPRDDLIDHAGAAYRQAILNTPDWNKFPSWQAFGVAHDSIRLDLEEQLALAENDDLYTPTARFYRKLLRLLSLSWMRQHMQRQGFYSQSETRLNNDLPMLPVGAATAGPVDNFRPNYHYADDSGRNHSALGLRRVLTARGVLVILWAIFLFVSLCSIIAHHRMLFEPVYSYWTSSSSHLHHGNIILPPADIDDNDYIIFVLQGVMKVSA